MQAAPLSLDRAPLGCRRRQPAAICQLPSGPCHMSPWPGKPCCPPLPRLAQAARGWARRRRRRWARPPWTSPSSAPPSPLGPSSSSSPCSAWAGVRGAVQFAERRRGRRTPCTPVVLRCPVLTSCCPGPPTRRAPRRRPCPPWRRPRGVLAVSVRTQWLRHYDAREADTLTDVSYLSLGQSGAPLSCRTQYSTSHFLVVVLPMLLAHVMLPH